MGAMAPRLDVAIGERSTLATRGMNELGAERHKAASRYRLLLGDAAWNRLPEAVRTRFSKPAAPGDVTLYRGEVVATELSVAGRCLAMVAKLIGAPLPAMQGATGPATVTVIEDAAFGGQTWTRVYPRPRNFPQVVHSAKRFSGPTGLEEYVGAGIGMTLGVSVEDGALVFRSERYFVEVFGRRVFLPRSLEPGRMVIMHAQEEGAWFSFRLTLTHWIFGRLIHQFAYFEEA